MFPQGPVAYEVGLPDEMPGVAAFRMRGLPHNPDDVLVPAAPGLLREVVAEHLEKIRAPYREYGVLRLEVFGSALSLHFDLERSAIDLLMECHTGSDLGS